MPYIGKSPSFGVRNRFVFTPDAGATSVSGADANSSTLTFTDGAFVDVYLNGVLLKPTTDYNTNTANTIAGLTATVANDEVTVIVYDVFAVGDTVSAVNGGTFVGNVTHSGTVTFGSTVSGLDVNGTEIILDADADTSITADTDDQIDIKIAGADDFQFTANTFTAQSGSTIAAQALTATTVTATGDVSLDGGSFVFNESSADKDFRVESNGNANMLFVDGGNDVIGIKTATPTDYYADDLVVTTPDEGGITIVGGTTERNYLAFADGTSGNAQYRGFISYDHNTDNLIFGAGGAGGTVVIDGNGIVTNAKQPAVIAHSNSNNTTSFSSADTYEIVQFNIETIDKNADYASSQTFTAPVDGTYYANANVLRTASSSGSITYDLAIYVNSTLTLYARHHGDNSSTNTSTQNVTGLLDLDASDTVQVYARVSDTKGQRYASNTTTYFHVFLVA